MRRAAIASIWHFGSSGLFPTHSESANLISVTWSGREKHHHLNPIPIYEIADRWIRKYERGRLRALADLKRRLENPEEDS